MQDVVDRVGVEVGCCRRSPLIDELEARREGFNSARGPVPATATQFDEVVRCGEGHQNPRCFQMRRGTGTIDLLIGQKSHSNRGFLGSCVSGNREEDILPFRSSHR